MPLPVVGPQNDYQFALSHTWPVQGPLGLKLLQRGETKSSPDGVVVENAAPFVPQEIKGLVIGIIAGEDVLYSSYEEVAAKLKAATPPLTVDFFYDPATPIQGGPRDEWV